MWPFSKKARFPGVIEHSDGTIAFSLSEDEAEAADRGLSNFRDVLLHPDYAEKVRDGWTAVALSHYAQNLVALHCNPSTEAEYKKNRVSIEQELRKAVAAVWKAYGLSQLPIYLYHRARYLKLLGMTADSQRLFALFLRRQRTFSPDKVDESLLEYEGTNIDGALTHAERHCSEK